MILTKSDDNIFGDCQSYPILLRICACKIRSLSNVKIKQYVGFQILFGLFWWNYDSKWNCWVELSLLTISNYEESVKMNVCRITDWNYVCVF